MKTENGSQKKLRMNTLMGLLSQVTTLICGFIIPKLILHYYGSEVNGLVSSITHFLSFISLAECGMGVVVQSSLYKPLADGDDDQVSRVLISSDRFFHSVGALLVVYAAALVFIYPHITDTAFDFWYVAGLLGAISISLFIQHYVCMSYRLLVIADQRGYVQLGLSILCQVLSTLFCTLAAVLGVSIQGFKLISSLMLILHPILLTVYVRRHYRINKKLKLEGEPIKQKWNGFAQHVAHVVLNNTDTVVLTFFSTLTQVSVYHVYFLVVNGIKTMVMATVTGMQSYLGGIFAGEDQQKLVKSFAKYERLLHAGVTFLFACTAVLIVPFVQVYTLGIQDTDYYAPLFGLLITLSQMAFCIRLPYNTMIFVAGHYKETQLSALIETGLNIIISVVMVIRFGLVGVAVGTLAAMLYRTTYQAIYLSRHILYRPFWHYAGYLVADALGVAVTLLLSRWFHMAEITVLQWVWLAVRVALIAGAVTVCSHGLLRMLEKRIDSRRLDLGKVPVSHE